MRALRAPITWLEGDARVQRAVDALASAPSDAPQPLRANPRRTLLTATLSLDPAPAASRGPHDPQQDSRPDHAPSIAVAIKIHHLATGRHPLRERIKRWLGRSPARREWLAQRALAAADVAVAAPLAYGRDGAGDELLVAAYVDGRIVDACDVERLSDALAALARARRRHGDLHLGNLVVDGDGRVVLLDLQHSRPCGSARDALADFASLELACRRAGWPAAARMRLRDRFAAALEAARADGAPGRRVASAEFDAALVRVAADRVRGRARRLLRSGRRLRAIHRAAYHGWRDAALGDDALFAALDLAEKSPARQLRRAGRDWVAPVEVEGASWIVKWSTLGPLARRIAAALRGSRAELAFRKGQRDQLLLAVAARPLAWFAVRRLGLPQASLLLLEYVGETDLDRHRPATPLDARRLAEAIGDWLADLHSAGLSHADFKGSNVRVGFSPDGPRFWLVDLEDLIGPRRLTDDERLSALAALNASLDDDAFDCEARETALRRYLARTPFADPKLDPSCARSEIVRRSLARAHRFRGGTGAAITRP